MLMSVYNSLVGGPLVLCQSSGCSSWCNSDCFGKSRGAMVLSLAPRVHSSHSLQITLLVLLDLVCDSELGRQVG